MVKQLLLLCVGVVLGMTAFADTYKSASKLQTVNDLETRQMRRPDARKVVLTKTDALKNGPMKASASKNVSWKRPAGQFWGTGYSPEMNGWYYFTPLVLRPWVDYTLENMSSVNGTPSWSIQAYDVEKQDYAVTTSSDDNVTVSYIRYETPDAPLLSYKNMSFPLMYSGQSLANNQGRYFNVSVAANNDIAGAFGANMLVSSHYWGVNTREPVDYAFTYYTGLRAYPGSAENEESDGLWFGTNNDGINAMATRFEKPDQPYLLNGVYFYYEMFASVPNDIPMKAYVFKTQDDAALKETASGNTMECFEAAELIAVSESFIPAAVYSEDDSNDGLVEFKFKEVNPVTGAESVVSLEIEDDITVVVTGFNVDPGNGGQLTSFLSNDTFDEGYGNLAFIGELEESENGEISYWLPSIKSYMGTPSTVGVLADVSYPWLQNYFVEQPSAVKLANEGDTTDEVQGLQYVLYLMSTSETDDFDVTFNGEEECDWLSIYDVYDEYETNPNSGEEEFTGLTAIAFEAAPNPNDETRTCKVEISIPAAKYEITFLQGSEASVEVVKVEGETQYFDLAGRRVVNPGKGIYVKVNGNKAEKVVL